MKCDTYDPYSPKVGNALFSLFTTALNTFFKRLPILFADSYAPFHLCFVCLIWSHIFNLSSLALIFGWI